MKPRCSRYHDPFLATLSRPVKQRLCDFPGCGQAGLYRAPKSREALNQYHWFCLDHVREYNKKWDYLAGLSPEEIERLIRNDTVWERPSWPIGLLRNYEKHIREKVARTFFNDPWEEDGSTEETPPQYPLGEIEALSVLGIVPPVKFAAIKARYRTLVKRHHPDANGGSPAAEEKLKAINQAYTLLKAIYDKNGKSR